MGKGTLYSRKQRKWQQGNDNALLKGASVWRTDTVPFEKVLVKSSLLGVKVGGDMARAQG